MRYILLTLCLLSIVSMAENEYSIGSCIIKNGSKSDTDILKIVSAHKNEYSTFSYFLSNGYLVQGQDYSYIVKSNITDKYSTVICPVHDSEFNPNKYLDKSS